jgi:hypothetical protein
MPLSTLRNWLTRGSARTGAARKKTHFHKCFLEVLEDRTLLSNYVVDVAGDTGALGLLGTPDTTDKTGLSGDLRYCISKANNDAGSTITFNTTAVGPTITLAQGELEISANMTITGPGAANLSISGNNQFRVFNIVSNIATVGISGLTITNGNASPAIKTAGNQGGDILNGGQGLTLSNDIVQKGVSEGLIGAGGPDGRGGGIFNAMNSSLTLDGTIVEGNTAEGPLGSNNPGAGLGGGIYNDTSAILILQTGSQVINNTTLGNTGISFSGTPGTGFNASGNGQGGQGGGGISGTPGGGAEGGGIFNNGTLTLLGSSAQPIVISSDIAQAGDGGGGENGGTGGTGAGTGAGGTGGTAGNAGSGGQAEGGGIFNSATGTIADFSQVVFANDVAQGGSSGTPGNGGTGGTGGGPGGRGGLGGRPKDGGTATGGAIANMGALGAISQTTFKADMALGGAASPAGGTGGKGGAGGGATDSGGIGGTARGGTTASGFPIPAGAGSLGGSAVGGAVANLLGALTVSASTFTGNQATGGAAGAGGVGGAGGTGGGSGNGGSGSSGQKAGVGGKALGGGLYNAGGVFTLDGGSFSGNTATSGAGAAGGKGGRGGDSGNGTKVAESGGVGGSGGNGSNAGEAAGGGVFNLGGALTVGATTGTTFTTNKAAVGIGGDGGAGGNGGNGRIFGGAGGAGGNGDSGTLGFGGALGVIASDLTVSSTLFGGTAQGNSVNSGASGVGGAGGTQGTGAAGGRGGGNGGVGGFGTKVYGGALAAYDDNTGTLGNLTLNTDTFTANSITSGTGNTGGAGGAVNGVGGVGGDGGMAFGGSVSYVIPQGSTNTTANKISITSSPFSNNQITAGGGGKGGSGGPGGAGGDGQDAGGGGLSISDAVGTLTATVALGTAAGASSTVTGNTVHGGKGGSGSTGNGNAAGGIGSSVHGGGIYTLNSTLTVTNSPVSSNVSTAGNGGTGAPGTGSGSNGGKGGSADGGGISFNNTSLGNLSFTYDGGASGSSVSSNQMTAGIGGQGGNAGGAGNSFVLGGSGGNGGDALGGGIFLTGNNIAANTITSTITNTELDKNVATAALGGLGGAGSSNTKGPDVGAFAAGGNGGSGFGGGFYNIGFGTQSITGSTLAGNQVTAGIGGIGGTGTTRNGGPGGNGGAGGNAEGGGIWNENNTLNVVNTTVGGVGSPNVLVAARGGAGNNAGTNGGVPIANGGNGGAGGSVQGGGVFIASGTTDTFTNATITANQAVTTGVGGNPGRGAGTGGVSGTIGTNGTGNGGGFFSEAATVGPPALPAATSQPGNTIIDLNTAADGSDVYGAFTSQGHNIIGATQDNTSTTVATGFVPSDKTGVTAAQLLIGPLLNNGGPTLTDALLPGSSAIDTGDKTNPNLAGVTTDDRSTGFARVVGNNVDVGAFEFQPPVITSISPTSTIEGGAGFTLTITGTSFEPGATVIFGGTTLTPAATDITNTQIKVTVPSTALKALGPIDVVVANPDGSGVAGQTVDSAAATFTVNPPSSLTLNQPPDQTNNEGDRITPLTITSNDVGVSGFTATGLPNGLSIDPNTGIISGKIDARAASSTTSFLVTVSASAGSVSGSTQFNWTVNDSTPPTVTNPGNQSNTVGDKINLQINAVDADAGTYTASNLPLGLNIDPNTGLITGTITTNAVGTYNVVLTASDGTVQSNPVTFTWAVAAASVSLTSPGDQTSVAGATITLPINSNGVEPGTFTASNLPPGLSINPTTGIISGVIAANAASGSPYSVTVSALVNSNPASTTFTWTVTAPTPTLTNPGNQTSNVGAVINLPTSSGTFAAGTFTASNLPPSLNINSATGVISGTITTPGTYNVVVSAANGSPASVPFTWTVNAGGGGGGGGGGSGSGGNAVSGPTSITIASIQNLYPGPFQLETVTVNVAAANGAPVNRGSVTFSVDGQTITAGVQNGTATATFANSFFNFGLLFDLYFPHALDAVYSDPNGVFGGSSASALEQGILFDFFITLFNAEIRLLTGQGF